MKNKARKKFMLRHAFTFPNQARGRMVINISKMLLRNRGRPETALANSANPFIMTSHGQRFTLKHKLKLTIAKRSQTQQYVSV
jgi:hypothetical protein